jgi:hypothetical protein
MKKIVRLTESDLSRVVKRVINENLSNKRSFNLDKPFITYRRIVDSILQDISVDVASELDVNEYGDFEEVPDYLKPYVKEVQDYVTSDDMEMKLWDAINDVIMNTPIHNKIVDDILSK